MIRPAKMQDIPAILNLLEDAHSRSIYADVCGIHCDTALGLLSQSVWGAKQQGSEFFAHVAETDGTIEGLIIGMAVPLYLIGDKLMVSDLFWVCSENVDPKDPIRLMKAMIHWAQHKSDVVEVRCGATPVIQSPEKASKMLKHLGMQPYGEFFRMEIN